MNFNCAINIAGGEFTYNGVKDLVPLCLLI